MTETHPANAVPVSVVKTIAQHVRTAVLTRYAVDSCIASTAVFLDVADWLRLNASPAAVGVFVANPAALKVMAMDPVPPVDQWPDDAWTVGVAPGQKAREGGWPGHLVAILHGDRHRLVDVSADQFDRPARALHVPTPVLGRLPERWGEGAQCVTHLHQHGTMLRWSPIDDESFRDTPNWDTTGDVAQQESRAVTLADAKARLTRAGITPDVFTPPTGGA